MKILRSILRIINYKTIIITLLSLASTWLCMRYGLRADFPLTLVGIAIVFPVVFSIDSAYKRRERALGLLADFKAHLHAMFLASRDWIDPPSQDFENEVKENLLSTYAAVRQFFVSDQEEARDLEKEIFNKVSSLSGLLMRFRSLGLQSGEVSRISQYVSKIETAVENMKVIFYYRTPITLRAYSRIFIYSFPILYGPYFVFVSEHYSHGLEYMMPIVFSFILVSLDNIQDHLENPFDQVGEDDIKFDVEEFSKMMD